MTNETQESTIKKPKNKGKIFIILLLIVALLLVAIGGYYYYKEIYLPSNTNYSLTVYADNEALIDEISYSKFDYVELQDHNQEPVDKIELTEDMKELKLSVPSNTDNLIFDEWQIAERNDVKTIKLFNLLELDQNIKVIEAVPIYQEAKDLILTFKPDENSKLISDENEVTYLTKPYKIGEDINSILPNVELKKGYKGNWTINNNIINDETEITKDSELVYLTYQDFNNNDLDDLKEKFIIQFETNTEQKIEPIENISWEETIDLPIVTDDKLIFYDWYEDPQLEKIFTEETKVQNNMTLYADVRSLSDVINNSVNSPIVRQDIALQVSTLLEDIKKTVDDKFETEQEQEEAEREALRQFNEENNIMTQELPISIEFHNTEHNKLHLISFLDPSNEFLFAFVAPYGQTIKITDETGKLVKEYGIRKQTHIVLDENKIIKNGKELDEYHTEYRQIHDTVYIKIQPITK